MSTTSTTSHRSGLDCSIYISTSCILFLFTESWNSGFLHTEEHSEPPGSRCQTIRVQTFGLISNTWLLIALTDTLSPFVVQTENTPLESWEADREMWAAYGQLEWFQNQQQEPKYSHNGKSIFSQWLNLLANGDWECRAPLDTPETWCGYIIRRHDRAIVHIRGHLGHKPFPCEGRCGREGWYVPKSSRRPEISRV